MDRMINERDIDFIIMEGKDRKVANIIYNSKTKESKTKYFSKFIPGFPKDPTKIKWDDINKFLQARNLSGIEDGEKLLEYLKETNAKIHSDLLWIIFN